MERGLTQQALAARLGISASYLNLIEHDQRSVTASLLIKLGEHLAVDLATLSGNREKQAEAGLREVLSDPLLGLEEVPEQEVAVLAASAPNAARAMLALYRAWRVAKEDASGIALPTGRRILLPTEEARDFFHEHANHFPALEAAAEALGAELRACGVDMSFTPVLDLDHGESGVIGDRAFHRDPQIVSVLAHNLMHGLLQSGMANCGKHFPGHGFVRADSHTEVPVDERSLKTILADDAKPYEWLPLGLTSIMPAHVIYPAVDALPAGFSSRWLQDILRRQLGFQGAIFSDDLSMEGARHIGGKTVSYTDAAQVALKAGCDMVLLCNQSTPSSEGGGQAVDDLLDGLWLAQQQGRWQASAASEGRRLRLLPSSPALDWAELMVDLHYMVALDALP
jgi:beta-N-acetylhexosaminidase